MKKLLISSTLACLLFASVNIMSAEAAVSTHTVVLGDSLWKIAVRYEVGVKELIQANPQIENINLIETHYLIQYTSHPQ